MERRYPTRPGLEGKDRAVTEFGAPGRPGAPQVFQGKARRLAMETSLVLLRQQIRSPTASGQKRAGQ